MKYDLSKGKSIQFIARRPMRNATNPSALALARRPAACRNWPDCRACSAQIRFV